MMFEYKMPKMDHMTEECMIMEWLVKEGDTVHPGDPVMRIETAKNALEAEAGFSGRIHKILAPTGEMIPVNTVIALVEEE